MDNCKVRKAKTLLEIAMVMEGGSKGNIQLYDPQTQELIIVAQKGFHTDFLNHFRKSRPFDSSCSGRAMGIQDMVTIGGKPLSQVYIIRITAQAFPVVRIDFDSPLLNFFQDACVRKNHSPFFLIRTNGAYSSYLLSL